jgi:hypothetical protein
MTEAHGTYKPISSIIDERSFVNAIIGLMATGGSTNHTIHLIAMAKAAGISLNWNDFDALSKVDRVVIINASVPRVWKDPNNELIAVVSARYPNVRIADWALASEGHPEYFISDGVHLTPAGVKAYIVCAQAAYLGP